MKDTYYSNKLWKISWRYGTHVYIFELLPRFWLQLRGGAKFAGVSWLYWYWDVTYWGKQRAW